MIQGYAIPNATMLGNNGAYKSQFYKALEGAKAAGATVEEAPCLLARGVEAYNDGLPSTPSLLIVPQFYKAGNLYQDVPPFVAEDTTMRFTVSRNTTATRVNSSGLIESVASGVPRIDWLGQSCPALLVEASGQNLALQSEAFNNAYWLKDPGVTVDFDVDVAPDGATTADRLNLPTNGAVYRSGFSLSGSHTFSVYLKGEGQNIGKQVLLEFTNGNSTVTLTGDWQRFTTTGTNIVSVAIKRATNQQATSVLAWGAQLETGSIATTYIPTTSGTVSRAADVISASGALVSGLIGQTEGTIYAEVDVRILGDGRFASVSDGTNNNRIQCRFNTGNNGVDFVVVVSGANVGFSISNSTHPSFPATIPAGTYKIALAYKQNDYVVAMNGVTYTPTVTTRNVPLNFSKVTIGADVGDLNQFNNRIRAAALYTTRLSNAQLAELTRL